MRAILIYFQAYSCLSTRNRTEICRNGIYDYESDPFLRRKCKALVILPFETAGQGSKLDELRNPTPLDRQRRRALCADVQPERNASFNCWKELSQPFPGRPSEVAHSWHTGEADHFWYWQRSSPLAKALAKLFSGSRGSHQTNSKFRNQKQKVN